MTPSLYVAFTIAFTAGLLVGGSLGLLIAALCRTASHPPTPSPYPPENGPHA